MTWGAHLSRRTWLKAVAGFGLAAGGSGLVGCNRENGPSGRQLKVFNWSDYIHPEVIPEFERLAGCKVLYDNYSMDSELEARLSTGGGGYDVVFPSDRSMPALLAKNLLREIDHVRLGNMRHLDPKFLKPPFDPQNRFSVPYFWGTVAVGIRGDFVKGDVNGFEALFDERYRGRITMLDDAENAIAAVLLYLRLPMNSVDPSHLQQAKEVLIEQKPLVQAYTNDAYKERLISGDAWVSLGWSGDLRQAADESPQVKVIVPQSGSMIWLDSMAIPKAAQNVELAHQFINYLLEPAVAARNAEAVHYATPNLTAKDMLPTETREDESIYPPQAILDRCQWLQNRGREVAKIEAVWREARQ